MHSKKFLVQPSDLADTLLAGRLILRMSKSVWVLGYLLLEVNNAEKVFVVDRIQLSEPTPYVNESEGGSYMTSRALALTY